MFLRSKICRKDGKEHRAWSVVENRRVHDGRVPLRSLERLVSGRFRGAAVRSDQHVFRMRSAGRGQAEVRLQPRQALRLRAGRNRADRHARWPSAGLRGHGRQHLGQDDAEGVPGQDRGAIRRGQTHLGDGSRRSDRGDPGRDAGLRRRPSTISWARRAGG